MGRAAARKDDVPRAAPLETASRAPPSRRSCRRTTRGEELLRSLGPALSDMVGCDPSKNGPGAYAALMRQSRSAFCWRISRSVLGSGPRGRWFKSSRPDQFSAKILGNLQSSVRQSLGFNAQIGSRHPSAPYFTSVVGAKIRAQNPYADRQHPLAPYNRHSASGRVQEFWRHSDPDLVSSSGDNSPARSSDGAREKDGRRSTSHSHAVTSVVNLRAGGCFLAGALPKRKHQRLNALTMVEFTFRSLWNRARSPFRSDIPPD
jgi:hypothetical protein